MTDKYENKIENDILTITIPTGPAADTYTKDFPTIEDGLIFIDHIHLPNGKIQALKIRASEHPSIVAYIEQRQAALRAKLANQPIDPESEIDRKMRAAGFESAGNAGALWNKLNPVHGENF